MKKLIDQWWALREDKSEKLRYDLVPLKEFKKLVLHYTTWAIVHGDRNREGWDAKYTEMCKQSARRHFIQWQEGETDEDHASACIWNIWAYEFLKEKNSTK